ncbi:tubulin delta chain-like [Anoplophora glabripennis]|uniref:tubulin delta chain-like n=1 Tax=Anoplophora glabripennis TaxID=217634 RepID=UPI0008746999|nr:tubulin delta chain-like [Anoplophora glabripennis]
MSVISLQFGQCGNQIGNSLYSTITQDINAKNVSKDSAYCNRIVNKWFSINKHGKWEPRSVLIDTEFKAIQSLEPLPYTFKNVVAKSFGGSANNWACGYTRNGKILVDEVMNVIRTETEKCDFLSSFLNLYSSSGGTGSGVGSFIIEQLRNDYPNKHIVNSIVLPYVKGEIVTQSYNSLLALAHLYSLADSTILFENERLHYTCKYALDAEDVDFSHMNTIIAQQLAALYQPLNIDTTCLLNNLTSHPSYKFLQMRSEPHFSKQNMKFEASKSWKTLMTTISKQSRFDYMYQKHAKLRNKTICSTLITRGSDHPTEKDTKCIGQNETYVPWLTRDNSFKMYHQTKNFLNFDKYIVLISNDTRVYVPLNFIVEDSWNMFNHGVYLHHYKKYGIDEDFFLNSFQVLENILDSYKCV